MVDDREATRILVEFGDLKLFIFDKYLFSSFLFGLSVSFLAILQRRVFFSSVQDMHPG